MKLSEQTLDDMKNFFFNDHGSGEGSLADRGCRCFMLAPCSRCTHPGNPVAVDAIEAWASPEDAAAFAELVRQTGEYLWLTDFKLTSTNSIGAEGSVEFARWVDYAMREVVLAWDLENNSPLFRARYGLWRTPFFATAEAAFVSAELDNWGRNATTHDIAAMMSAMMSGLR